MRLGKPLPLSDDALTQLAKVTPADVLASKALFQSTAPKRYRTLLDASVAGSSVSAETLYAWDPKEGQYIYLPTGRHINPLEIRNQAVEPMIRRSKETQRALSAQLQSQEIGLAEWQTQMIGQIKQAQTAAGLAANGGEKNTNDSDKEEIALLILALLLLFKGFGQDIQRKTQPLNGFLMSRSDLYANAARGTFEAVGGYVARVYLGRAEEKRILGEAEHCHTVRGRAESILGRPGFEGCVELAAKGWQPINSLPPIGVSPCRSNCKCRFIYR
jgi:hypothetical protein